MRENFAAVHHIQGGVASGIVVLTAEYVQEKEQWLAECLELGTAAFSSTLEQARDELMEAVGLQLNEVERLGFIDAFLKSHRVREIPIKQPHTPSSGRQSTWEPQLVGV